MAARRASWHFPAYLGGLGTLGLVAADHYLDLRKWKSVNYSVPLHDKHRLLSISLHARTRPPPIGQMEWPGGRILLQWALDEGGLGSPSSGGVLEIGAGIGLTAIGLALARQDGGSHTAPQAVVATDICDSTLALLRANGDRNGCGDAVHVAHWDAAAGQEALGSLPIPLSQLAHIVGADVVYYGFGTDTDASGDGLCKTLAALLDAKPSLSITLMVTDRFSGGAVAALSGAAGVNSTSPNTTVDPAVLKFERSCSELGLVVHKQPVPRAVLERVWESQWPMARLYWSLAGFYDGISLVRVEPRKCLGRSEECA